MGEPAPPEPSKPNPSESSDATANDATASDATVSDDTASDQILEEQEGSPVHPDDLLEARDSPQRSPHRDDVGARSPRVDYTHYKATGMHRLRHALEANWFPTARDPHGTGFKRGYRTSTLCSSDAMRVLRQVTSGASMSTYIDRHAYFSGIAALSFVAVERLTPHTGATEEDPDTAGEGTPASVMRPTTEDDTTAAAEVSSTAFVDVDKAAGRPMPLKGATEDHPSTEEDRLVLQRATPPLLPRCQPPSSLTLTR
ncbi:hypothetical protein E2562_008219 [Oryza meyeriana var. granulata]|uniref:Uncharacterized protein n=1 Tax=Oryza meyeriana var. granulata TaxID=110450 RepID=A0A6G1DFV9_9ORYZ|nr:hypothetical protein E2562_008219 [Oryza meyeriana var. granulata]